jgi:hypothetical protein
MRGDNAAHGTALIIRQIKYRNKGVEQDHRGVKRISRPRLGLKSVEAAPQGTAIEAAVLAHLQMDLYTPLIRPMSTRLKPFERANTPLPRDDADCCAYIRRRQRA